MKSVEPGRRRRGRGRGNNTRRPPSPGSSGTTASLSPTCSLAPCLVWSCWSGVELLLLLLLSVRGRQGVEDEWGGERHSLSCRVCVSQEGLNERRPPCSCAWGRHRGQRGLRELAPLVVAYNNCRCNCAHEELPGRGVEGGMCECAFRAREGRRRDLPSSLALGPRRPPTPLPRSQLAVVELVVVLAVALVSAVVSNHHISLCLFRQQWAQEPGPCVIAHATPCDAAAWPQLTSYREIQAEGGVCPAGTRPQSVHLAAKEI